MSAQGVGVAVGTGVSVGRGVGVSVGTGVSVGSGVGVSVSAGPPVSVGVGVSTVPDEVGVAVAKDGVLVGTLGT